MERSLSAAGKLFLSGEYAVLWGGISRIACVGPRTEAHVRRRDDREVWIVIDEGLLRGMTTPLGVSWSSEVTAPFHFVARTIDLALRAHGKEALGFELALSASPRSDDGQKLGLGSSARATVLAAEACRFILEDRYDTLKLALAAHAQAQGGKGSGGDVAASFAGGIIRYRRYDLARISASAESGPFLSSLLQAPPVDLWKLPDRPVHLSFVFTGESASTSSMIGQVEAKLDAKARAAFVGQSDVLGQQLEEGMLSGDFGAIVSAVNELQKLLSSLGALETESMRRALALARSYGAVGKMSGAGGGDGCVVFSPSAEVQQEMLDGMKAREFLALPLTIEAGLRGEQRPNETLMRWLAPSRR